MPQSEDVIYIVRSIESGCVALSFKALTKKGLLDIHGDAPKHIHVY